MGKKAGLCIFLFLLFWGVSLSWAEERLHVGILDLPPLYEVDEKGKPAGILLEFLTRILEDAGFSYELAVYPPRRLYWNIAHGRCHVFLGVKGVPELEGKVFYGKKKITDIDMRVYALKGRELPEQKEGLYGKRVIVIRGYSYSGFITDLRDPAKGTELMEASDHVHAFRQLAAGRGDYVLDYKSAAEHALVELKMGEEVGSHSLGLIGVFLKVSKQVENAEGIMVRLETAWDRLEASQKLPSP